MKPIDQTVFGEPDGNCYHACLASILEIPLERIPPRLGKEKGELHAQVNDFLRPYGLAIIVTAWTDGEPWFGPHDAWHVLSGPSPRGNFNHSTVGYGGKMVHDPHPSRAGLIGMEREVDFFLVLTPGILNVVR